MKTSTGLCSILGIDFPIIQAPMGGGPTTPELIAAVSNAGALGSLGASAMSPSQIAEAVAAIRLRTDRPFNVNLFAGGIENASGRDAAGMIEILAPYHQTLGLPAPVPPQSTADPFEAQLAAVLDARPPIFSFTFGIPQRRGIRQAEGSRDQDPGHGDDGPGSPAARGRGR